MENFIKYFNHLISDWEVFVSKLFLTLVLFIGLLLIDKLISRILDTKIESSTRSIMGHHFLRLIYIILMLIGIVLIWFASYEGIGILFLILFALIALGIKDILIDILAFLYIMTRHPFKIKDYIKVESNLGQVVDIDLLQFHMEEYGANLTMVTPTGKFITYPNRIIFQQPIFNYSHDHDLVKMEESIVLAFDQDTDHAIEILQGIAKQAYDMTFEDIDEQQTFFFKRYLKEHGGSLEPFVWVDREDLGYRLHIIYTTPISKISRNRRFIQVAMQKELTQAGYNIVVPQALKLMD